MDLTTNAEAPGLSPEASNPTTGHGLDHPQNTAGATIWGWLAPSPPCAPASASEAERERIAEFMRKYAADHPGQTYDMYMALAYAGGYTLPPGCTFNEVMGPGVNLAHRRDWIRFVGSRICTEPRAHSGLVRLWRGFRP